MIEADADDACGDTSNPSCFTPALSVETCRWGDTAPMFENDPGAVFQPDIADVAAVVSKFLGQVEPTRPMSDLEPNVPNVFDAIDFRDIAIAVTAIIEEPYPFEGPQQCP